MISPEKGCNILPRAEAEDGPPESLDLLIVTPTRQGEKQGAGIGS